MPVKVDETNPQLLVIHPGTEHTVDDYETFLKLWSDRLMGDDEQRFAVIMVHEPHEHDHDEEDHERHEEEEARLIKMINDFRRDYRVKSNKKTIAFVNVYDPDAEWIQERGEEGWEKFQQMSEQRANYMFGTRGRNFTDLDEAKQWVESQVSLPPVDIGTNTQVQPSSNKKVGLFFGSTTGVTEDIAYQIQEVWQAKHGDDLSPINIGNVKDLNDLLAYDYLILGVPTWNVGQLQDDWDIIFPDLSKLDFTGKQIALFGIGDQYGYPDNFLDALGILGKQLRDCGATLVGFTSTENYEFAESVGVEGDKFMGLGIDEIHQDDLTPDRIDAWVAQLIQEFALQPA